jgi:feruloyl esterase
LVATAIMGISPRGAGRAQQQPLRDSAPKPAYPDTAPARSCESLKSVALPDTTIESASEDARIGACQVVAVVTHPPAGDHVKVWVALPTRSWNGRFMGTGGGGFLGGAPQSLPPQVAQGFACGATDTGHEGGSASFALDAKGGLNWQSIRDNAYLGIHDMTVTGKALTEAFYGKAPRYSYFIGGSTGGRQGLSEAQRYPADYNGIVSSFPAINWGPFTVGLLWPQVVMREANDFISESRERAISAAVVDACDARDGVKDGVIDDPIHLAFDPKSLVGSTIGGSPFTETDAEVMRKIWQGPRTRKGEFLWYGLTPSTDLTALAGTEGTPLRGRPFSIAMDYFRYYLKQDPNWDASTLTSAELEQLYQQSVEEFGPVIGTDNPDLTKFRDRGGKVIILHGMIDQLIPVEGSIDYFQRVEARMGGPKRTGQFARLFLAPGVAHGGGTGPYPVGLPEAIIRWVEAGKAPDGLRAELRDRSGKVVRTRPLFPFPQVAKYKGSGSTDDMANFVSALPAPTR